MKLLETWVGTPLAGAVGWTLLHSLWEGAILAVALAAVLMATRSPRVRYAAACVAMLVMLGAFGVTFIRMMPEGAAEREGREEAAVSCMECCHEYGWRWILRILYWPKPYPGWRRSGWRECGFSICGMSPAGYRYRACAGGECAASPSIGGTSSHV